MTPERIIEEMAGLDCYVKFARPVLFEYGMAWGEKESGFIRFEDLPDYLHDHNAVQRVIDGMDWDTLKRYWDALSEIIDRDATEEDVPIYLLMQKAECPQVCEAALKARGMWESRKKPSGKEKRKCR